MSISKTTGMVLKYTNYGEADRILTLLTMDKGKIKAYVKGCRRPKSALRASSELFAFSDFVLFKGTNFYHVSGGELREAFYNLRNDLVKLSYAVYLTELADTITDENISSRNVLLLLARTLYYLSNGEISMGILISAYQLKIMDLAGYRPSLDKCVKCGKSNLFNRFSIELGSVLCKDCGVSSTKTIPINEKTPIFLKTLLDTRVYGLKEVEVENNIFVEADKLIHSFVQLHLDKTFKSIKFINDIKMEEALKKDLE